MTEEEWEQVLKDVNNNCKKWVDEEVFKAQYNVVKNIIQRDTQMTEKPLTHEENDKAFKDSLRLIEEWGEKNKPPTLKELLTEWAYTKNNDVDVDEILSIVEKWLPPSSSTNDYHWERCIEMLHKKLK